MFINVKLMQIIITAVLSLYGLTPFWCDSCGESYLTDYMTVCDVCGAHLCSSCVDAHTGAGCFVCEGDPTVQGHDPADDITLPADAISC